MGPCPARDLYCWKARSLTSEEGPKLGVGQSPTFGKGPKNLSNLFSKFKGPSKAKARNSWKGLSLGPARAWPGPVFLGL